MEFAPSTHGHNQLDSMGYKFKKNMKAYILDRDEMKESYQDIYN